jgi:hypothetical protein
MWAVEETGKYSVTPSINPSIVAWGQPIMVPDDEPIERITETPECRGWETDTGISTLR